MRDLAERYLDALLAHDSERVFPTPRYPADTPDHLRANERPRMTENGVERPLGEGLWQSIRGVLTRQINLFGRGAALITGVADDGQNAIFAIRLARRSESSLTPEVEVLVTHKGESSIFGPESLFKRGPVAPLLQRDRTPQEDMQAAVHAYFDGIERGSSEGVPFHPLCDRIENGVRTTRNPEFLGGLDVRQQLDRNVFAYIEKVRGRRLPVVDEETGRALAIVFLDVPGTVTELSVGGRVVQLPPHVRQPRSTLLFELFHIERGCIRAIDAFMHNLPYGASSGW